MSEALVQQLLYGYSDGHRLLAASTEVPSPAARALLVQSDAQPGPDHSRTLSSFALAEAELWALTATWPADEISRPGSVWSHTLLLDTANVSSLRGVAGLLSALHRPASMQDLDRYRQPLSVTDEPLGLGDASLRTTKAILLGLYGWPTRQVGVLSADLQQAERILLAVWEQQWSSLRTVMTFATRARLSASDSVQIQVAAARGRASTSQAIVLDAQGPGPEHEPSWVATLLGDLRHPGTLRDFFWRYGPGLTGGRADVASLARIHAVLSAEDAEPLTFAAIAETYPAPSQAAVLKRDCLAFDGPAWRVDETMRLSAAIEFLDTVEWEQLEIAERLAALWRIDHTSALSLAANISRRRKPKRLIKSLQASLAPVADTDMLRGLAGIDVRLAAGVAVKNQRALADPVLWSTPADWQQPLLTALASERRKCDPVALTGVLSAAERDDLLADALALGLIDADTVAAAIAADGASARSLARWNLALAKALAPAARAAARPSASWQERLLAAAVPSDERPALLLETGDGLVSHLADAEEPVRQLVAAVLLAHGIRGHGDRRVIFAEAFPVLHRAIAEHRLPKEAWAELDKVLPGGRQQTPAKRLRQAAVDVIREDRWSAHQVTALIERSGPGAEGLRSLAKRRSELGKLLDAAWKAAKPWE